MPELFFEIADCFVRKFGTPLPKELLRVGDVNHKWHITLNPTEESLEGIQPFTAHVQWFGFPAGIIDPAGGVIAAGELANEESLLAWLKEQ